MDFILQYKNLVHPNILKSLHKKDKEDIRMTLNQIHYGTIRSAKDMYVLKATAKNV